MNIFRQFKRSIKTKIVSSDSILTRISLEFIASAFTFLLFPVFLFAQVPAVTSFEPANNALNIERNASITITFSQDIDAATLTNSTVHIDGSLTGIHTGMFSYNSGTHTAAINPAMDFQNGEIVSVTLTRGIKNIGGDSLASAVTWSFSVKVSATTGTFVQTSSLGVGSGPYCVTAGDFNKDGDLDLAVANFYSDNLSILMNNGNGTFTQGSTPNSGNRPISISAGDFDGDEDLDLAVVNWGYNTVTILLNDGNGTFTNSSAPGVGLTPYSVTAGDFDRDGDLDLAVANYDSDTLSILSNNGSGTFNQSSTPGVGSKPLSVIGGDYDGDADIDLAVANYTSNTVSILLNNGNGTFTENSAPAVGSNPRSVIAGDFDGDGDIDLATANYGSNNISILLNNGNGTFSLSSTPGVGNGPRSIIAGDVEGDGDLDLAVANYDSDTVSILLNNGSGTFTQSSTLGVGSGPRSVAAADLNGDGDIDFAIANHVSNTVTILNNIPSTPQSLVVVDSSDKTVTIKWRRNIESSILRYRIYVDTFSGPTTKSDSTSGGVNDTSKTIRGLQNGTKYYFRVKAIDNPYIESGYSNEVSATPQDRTAPDIPKNLIVTDSSDHSITINWNRNREVDLFQYRIYSGTNLSSMTLITSAINNADTARVFTKLINGIRYYFRVTAVDHSGNESGFSKEVNAVPADRIMPAAPQSLVAADSSNLIIAIKWRKNIEADFMRYRIFRGTNPNPTIQVDSITSISDTTKIFTGLTVGTRYYFRIAAVDSADNVSEYSNEANAAVHRYITFKDGSSYYAPDVVQNRINNPVGRFKLTADLNGAALTSVKVTFSGSYSSVTSVKLWSSADSIFGGDQKLDSVKTSGSPVTLNGSASAIDTGGTYYFVTADLGASSGSISAVIAVNDDITLAGGTLAGNLSNAHLTGNVPDIIAGVDNEKQSILKVFTLNQNYPNPFNPTTTITFTLGENSHVTLKVFDITGREVATLVNSQLNAGVLHQAVFDASQLSSGFYFYRLETEKNVQVKKLMLLK